MTEYKVYAKVGRTDKAMSIQPYHTEQEAREEARKLRDEYGNRDEIYILESDTSTGHIRKIPIYKRVRGPFG